MKKPADLDRVILREILKLRSDGVSRERAFVAARLVFQLKQRLIEGGLKSAKAKR